jgi:hypothetical protein
MTLNIILCHSYCYITFINYPLKNYAFTAPGTITISQVSGDSLLKDYKRIRNVPHTSVHSAELQTANFNYIKKWRMQLMYER